MGVQVCLKNRFHFRTLTITVWAQLYFGTRLLYRKLGTVLNLNKFGEKKLSTGGGVRFLYSYIAQEMNMEFPFPIA